MIVYQLYPCIKNSNIDFGFMQDRLEVLQNLIQSDVSDEIVSEKSSEEAQTEEQKPERTEDAEPAREESISEEQMLDIAEQILSLIA